MLYLLHGDDTYRSRGKLREIIGAFRARAGGVANVTVIDAEEESGRLAAAGQTQSLFDAKELIVVKYASRAPDAARALLLGRIRAWAADADRTVVFFEAAPPQKGDRLLQAVARHADKVQEFAPMTPAAAARWLRAQAEERGVRLTARDAEAMIARRGGESWALATELDMARDGWAPGGARHYEGSRWAFSDSFLASPRESLPSLMRLLASGEEPVAVVSALAASLRSLAIVWYGAATRSLAKATASLHPFAVRKLAPLASRLKAADIRERFEALLAADLDIKTGRLPPALALLRLVLGRKRTPAA